MANFLDKMKVKVATKNQVKLDLSCDHISTANFMQYNIAWTKELVPNEKISVNMETFTRLNPMPVPTFGRAAINNRAFFVPFRTIMPAWTDFITDTTHVGSDETGVVTRVPAIQNVTLSEFFFTPNEYQLQVLMDQGGDARDLNGTELGISNIILEGGMTPVVARIDTDVDEPDFVAVIASIYDEEFGADNYVYVPVKLTAFGRQVLKILNSLGYQIYPNILSDGDEVSYSALPILAIAKVYCDWYYPSAYAQNDLVTRVEQLFNNDFINAFNLSHSNLLDIFNLVAYVNYDSDYFVSAWDKPYAPNDDTISSDYSLVDPNNGANIVSYEAQSGAPGLEAGSGIITQWAVDALKRVTDYIKRHQLVGSRALDRYMARFGVNLSPEKLKRSVYIGSGSTAIKFGDVTSTSSTEGAALGQYAGKGIGYDNNSFDFETDEYGIMIIVSTIQPKTGYYQGIDRNLFHTQKADYWTPEFDNLGVQGISKSELFVPTSGYDTIYESSEMSASDLHLGLFGYIPRYAEYKVGRDRLTGDLKLPSVDVSGSSWHTLRKVDYSEGIDIVHNIDFVRGIDAGQYSRIFYNVDADENDKFNVIYSFDIASWSPMKPLFDTYEFDGGQKVSMDVNGVKMN